MKIKANVQKPECLRLLREALLEALDEQEASGGFVYGDQSQFFRDVRMAASLLEEVDP